MFKSIFDVLASFILIIVLSPLLVMISFLIKVTSKGPVLFIQKRVGQNKKHFNMLKFRTMRIDAPKNVPTHQLDNPDTYLTPIGKILRKTSLDELPQLWNILIRDMSFIGPRPALWNQYDLIEYRESYRVHDVLPGITGWAQVYGRDALSIEDKAKLDGLYINKIGLLTDLKILLRTVLIVIKSEGNIEGGTGTLNKGDKND